MSLGLILFKNIIVYSIRVVQKQPIFEFMNSAGVCSLFHYFGPPTQLIQQPSRPGLHFYSTKRSNLSVLRFWREFRCAPTMSRPSISKNIDGNSSLFNCYLRLSSTDLKQMTERITVDL